MRKNHLFSYKDWSFKKKLLVMISGLIIAMFILISSTNYLLYSRNFTKQTINQTQQIIEQVALNVDTYLDELFRLNLSPYYNDTIMEELEQEYETKTSDLNRKRSIENFLASVMTLPRNEILRVYILTDSNLYAYTRTPYDMEDYNNYKETDWYQKALETSAPVFIPVHAEKVFGDKPTQLISIAQRIRSKEDNSRVLAVIKVDADYSGIKSICDKVQLKERGSLFILDDNKNLVYQNNQRNKKDLIKDISTEEYQPNGSYTQIIGSEKYIINAASLKAAGLKVIAINSDRELNKDARAIRDMTLLLSFACLLLSLVLLFILIQNFLKPLFDIVKLMKQVQNGDLSVEVEIKNNDEVGYLARSFNKMIQRITEMMEKNTQLIKEVYESRYLQKEAQYNILCSQIKPHFLYNTLNTISLLMKCQDTKAAIQSIEKLSCFMRGIMNSDKNISLSRELEIVDAYLGIQKARYGDHLNYEISVPADYKEYIIPALTLQPIVENAIIHGCEVKRGKSTIRILSLVQDSCFIIHIKDDGAGIEDNKLKILNEELSQVTSLDELEGTAFAMTESIGLINVNKRIKLKYGNDYGLRISSTLSEGTLVEILLPSVSTSSKERSLAHVSYADC